MLIHPVQELVHSGKVARAPRPCFAAFRPLRLLFCTYVELWKLGEKAGGGGGGGVLGIHPPKKEVTLANEGTQAAGNMPSVNY